MTKYECEKCGGVLDEGDTYLAVGEAKIGMDPMNPDKESIFPVPIRRHKGGCDGETKVQ